MMITAFNVRVYGICIENECVLVSDEVHNGVKMVKFPGGGLDFGEGIVACLQREFIEEANLRIHVGDVYYVNPFLQVSAFRKNEQIISMYFWIQLAEKTNFSHQKWDFQTELRHEIVLRWERIEDLNPDDFTFPIDKSMVAQIRRDWGF